MEEEIKIIEGIVDFPKPAAIIAVECPHSKNFLPTAIAKKEFLLGNIFYKGENHFFRTPEKFIENLLKFKCLFSYNGESFIYLMLEKYGLKVKHRKDNVIPEGIISIDVMRYIEKQLGFRMRLQDLADLNFEGEEPVYGKDLDLTQLKENLSLKCNQIYSLLKKKKWKVA